MYGYFESNLRDVIRVADRAGASVVLATVPINLRSCPPFGSLHREGLAADARARASAHFDAGRAAQRAGDCRAAMAAWAEAAAIDDRWADLSFAMAQCTATLGEDGRRLWARARDLDSLRFRADGRINKIIRDVAARPRARDVVLVDLEEAISAAAAGGTPGDDLLVDHVHLDLRGNVIAARATLEALRPRLAGVRFRELPGDLVELEALVRRRLVYDARAELQIASVMYQRKTRPPFVGQLDHDAEMARLRARLVTLRAAARGVTWPDREQALLAALATRPDDGVLVQRLAEHYGQGGHVERALALVEPRLRAAPWDGDLRSAWLDTLIRAGRPAEAVAFLGTGADGTPLDRREALVQVGSKLIQFGRADLAGPVFQEVVTLDPGDVQALMNLGALAVQAGDAATAVRHLTRALELAPDSAQAMVTLASACVMQGRTDDGLRWYRAATEADPHNHLAWYGLALLRFNAGALRESVQNLMRVTELNPEYVDGHRLLAAAYERLGDGRRAAEEQRLAEAFAS
jgi:tetratricopeptide (TPR) repeat protein